MNNLDDILEHSGVKGMKWGVIRNRLRPGGADGRPDAKDVKRSKIGRRLDSMKRERQWTKVLNNAHKMDTKDIQTAAKRIKLENQYKVLTKTSKMASRHDRDEYLRRHKMSDQELARKVARLNAMDGLHKSVKEASKEQRAMGMKLVQVGGHLAVRYVIKKKLGQRLDANDIFKALMSNPKNDFDKAQESIVKKMEARNKLISEMANAAINAKKPKVKS